MSAISPDSQAILLLTASFGRIPASESCRPLAFAEYRRLAVFLREGKHRPSDLLSTNADSLIHACREIVDPERLRALLARGFLSSRAIDRWSSRTIWFLTRADPAYPMSLKKRLRDDAPAVIWGSGEKEAMKRRSFAVLGPNVRTAELARRVAAVASMAEEKRIPVISDASSPLGRTVIQSVGEREGSAIGVIADGLDAAVLDRMLRNLIVARRLLLISAVEPFCEGDPGPIERPLRSTMALSAAALIESPNTGLGDLYFAAEKSLADDRTLPIFVRPDPAVRTLERLGARIWTEPRHADELAKMLGPFIEEPRT